MAFLLLPDGRQVSVTGDNFIIGSDPACDLCLQDHKVASRHAVLQYSGEYWQLATLNLEALTRLNSTLVDSLARLHDGDNLQFGDTVLTWNEGEAEPVAGRQRVPYWVPAVVIAVACVAFFGIWVLFQGELTGRGQRPGSEQSSALTAAEKNALMPYGNVVVSAPVYIVILPLDQALTVDADAGYTISASALATITPQVSAPVYRVKAMAPITASGPVSDTSALATPEPLTPDEASVQPTIASGPPATAEMVEETTDGTAAIDESGEERPPSTPMVLFTDFSGTATAEASLSPEPGQSESILVATPSPDGECISPQGWQEYTLQEGETLTDLAIRYDVTVRLLAWANCLVDGQIEAGDILFVPAS